MKHARNIAIIVVLAVAVAAVPGGSDTAGLVGAVFSLLFVALIAYFAGRFYRDHQVDVYGLGDVDRAVLYGAIALIAIVLVGWGSLFHRAPGTIVAIALLALAAGGLMRVYRNWQRY